MPPKQDQRPAPAERSTAALRVLVADDHPLVRAGLSALLAQEPGFVVVAEAADGAQAVECWRQHRPDVTLMDLSMPALDGIAASRRIRELDPLAAIVILTTFDGDEDIFQAMQAGARGYLQKDAEPAELSHAIRTAHEGKTYLPPHIATKLLARLQADALTERELDIIRLVVLGQANKVIARELSVSEGTVKTHIKAILSKLDATSRTEAVSIALRRGIVRMP